MLLALDSLQKMESMIKLCLTMAAKDKFSSIAFPTVGCGKLNYQACDVARCFANAQQTTGVKLQVSLVIITLMISLLLGTYCIT